MSPRNFVSPVIALAILIGIILVPTHARMNGGDGDGGKGVSPIFIDPLCNGLPLTSVGDGVLFDIDGDGDRDQVAWTHAGTDDALLAIDLNGNGTIDNARELLGEYSQKTPDDQPHGFGALAWFDVPANGGNGDDRIDSGDAVWNELYIWRDVNHDGISQAVIDGCTPQPGAAYMCSELIPLRLFVKRISLQYYSFKWYDANGNWFRYVSDIVPLTPGVHEWWACDVYLQVERTRNS